MRDLDDEVERRIEKWACCGEPVWRVRAERRVTELEADNERLRAALLDIARRVEALKRPCGMDPETPQAIRNGEYMSIALMAHAALTHNVK